LDNNNMTYTDEYKLSYFNTKAVQVAKEARHEILTEIEQVRCDFLEKQTAALVEELKAKESENEKELLREINKNKSDLLMEHKRSLLLLKENFKKEIFDKVSIQLVEFKKSEHYFKFLCQLLSNCIKVFNNGFILYLSPDDKGISDQLSEYIHAELNQSGKACNVTFEYDKTIKLGGIRLYSETDGIIINETLDERFDSEKNTFTERFSI